MNQNDLSVCATCPWLFANHGKRKPVGWYGVTNLRRLWNGVRTGKAPGMVCHSSDPDNDSYGGPGRVKPGKKAECGGTAILMLKNMEAVNNGLPQPVQPPFNRFGLASIVERYIFQGWRPTVARREDVGVPWLK